AHATVATLAHSTALALARIPRGCLLSPPHPDAPLDSFGIDGVHPHDAAQVLADAGLALRSGHLCAQPLLRSLSLSACLRASFCLANTQADADALLAAIPSILALFP
ncbi:MAG: aminotransferase class V-fold PLP-dependent enzyme, partial [Kiritimatiellae bacterium]|nr:aminotransferase class V-fold PLP-dependent enzyme [Kiritimatiellia bacterium]